MYGELGQLGGVAPTFGDKDCMNQNPRQSRWLTTWRGSCIYSSGKGGSRTAPTEGTQKCKPLSRLIGAFKTVSTKQINIIRNTPSGKLWQRNYYEHVIRNEEELNHIRQYIADNRLNWRTDEENRDVMLGK
jgi:REP element-mobilizing transposase RayT